MTEYASLESQLGDAVCAAEDSEEMFWLRESDDYQSKVRLGNLLSGQYRFKEAITAYQEAELIRDDDPMLFLRLGGAHLTLRHFEKARLAYDRCLSLGMDEKRLAFYFGYRNYLLKDYKRAAERFARSFPTDDATAICAIYWHCLCCLRLGRAFELLPHFREGMEVGHHTAYVSAVSVFAGKRNPETTLGQLEQEESDLNFVILAYGLSVYLESLNCYKESQALRDRLLEETSVWPSTPYLAAWGDTQEANS